jgi:ubiquinone/menaquinone biosynthesis C-methylase UbiE
MKGMTPCQTGIVASPRVKYLFAALLFFVVTCSSGCTDLKRLAYEGFDRDTWQKPEQVIDSLHIQFGDTVADLGAGSGYFTHRLADAVSPDGKVYAVDVDEGMLEYLKERMTEEGRKNVEAVLAEYHDPLLPTSGVDLIFTCNTYHHLKDRVTYFTKVRKYLREGGRVAIMDFNGEGWFQQLFGHFTPREIIISEMEAAGYQLQAEHDFLSSQVFLVFSSPSL